MFTIIPINSIVCGDNLDIMKQMDDKSIDLFFFSPPYLNIKNKYNNNISDAPGDYNTWLILRFIEMYRILKESGSVIINIDDCVIDGFRSMHVFDLVLRITKETNFKLYERLFWNKGKSLCHSKRFRSNVEYLFWFTKNKDFTFNIDEMRVPYDTSSLSRMKNPIKKRFVRNKINQEEKIYKDWAPHPNGALPSVIVKIGSEARRISDSHVAVFPTKLCDYFIKGSTNEGDIVCDPFCGLSSTGISALKLNRKFIGIEIDKNYCLESQERFKKENLLNINIIC